MHSFKVRTSLNQDILFKTVHDGYLNVLLNCLYIEIDLVVLHHHISVVSG